MRKRLLCVSGGASSVCFERAEGWESVDVGCGCHDRPSEALTLASLSPNCAAGFASLAVVHDTPSPMAGLRHDTPSAMVAGLFCGFFCGAAGGFFCGGSAC